MVYFGLGCVGNMVGVGTARQVCHLRSCRALCVCCVRVLCVCVCAVCVCAVHVHVLC
jgi:hypothetical protein